MKSDQHSEYEVVDHADKEAFISIYDPENRLGLMTTAPPPRHPNSQRFHDIMAELGDLHDRKQADYGKGDDPFANVRSSEEWGVEGWKGAMIRLNDKVKRLQNYARNGNLKNEGVVDSLMDIAVYAVIAQVLWEQEQA